MTSHWFLVCSAVLLSAAAVAAQEKVVPVEDIGGINDQLVDMLKIVNYAKANVDELPHSDDPVAHLADMTDDERREREEFLREALKSLNNGDRGPEDVVAELGSADTDPTTIHSSLQEAFDLLEVSENGHHFVSLGGMTALHDVITRNDMSSSSRALAAQTLSLVVSNDADMADKAVSTGFVEVLSRPLLNALEENSSTLKSFLVALNKLLRESDAAVERFSTSGGVQSVLRLVSDGSISDESLSRAVLETAVGVLRLYGARDVSCCSVHSAYLEQCESLLVLEAGLELADVVLELGLGCGDEMSVSLASIQQRLASNTDEYARELLSTASRLTGGRVHEEL